MPEEKKPTSTAPVNESVTNRILRSFVDSLEKQEGMADVATRLKAEILQKTGRSEAAIRAALFGTASKT